jgi:hypothetical protein
MFDWNKNKGHPKPEKFKGDNFIITRQIQELNYKIWEINDQLNKTSVKISKYYFRASSCPEIYDDFVVPSYCFSNSRVD